MKRTKHRKFKQRPAPLPPELTTEDFTALNATTEPMNDAWRNFEQVRNAACAEMIEPLTKMVAAYDEWRAKAAAWLPVAERFRLTHHRTIRGNMQGFDREMEFLRDLVETAQRQQWPAEVEQS